MNYTAVDLYLLLFKRKLSRVNLKTKPISEIALNQSESNRCESNRKLKSEMSTISVDWAVERHIEALPSILMNEKWFKIVSRRKPNVSQVPNE